MATNSEKLDELTKTISDMKIDIAVIKSAQLEQTKILKGNGVTGLVDQVKRQDIKLNQLDNTMQCLLEEKKEENKKRSNRRDRWYWLLVEKFAVPIAMAAITAYILAPLLAR